MQKKALGRGLDALFDRPLRDGAVRSESPRILNLDIGQIIPNRYQPRKVFNDEELDRLAASMKGKGVLQPVLVRPAAGGKFELIAGERRWRAAGRAGLERIPAVLREATDEEAVEWALVENLQRQDLNPIEAAKAYRRLIDEFRLTQEDLAQRVGKDRSSVANTLRLLSLPPEVQEAVNGGGLSEGHAKVLLSLSRARDQIRWARKIEQKGLSVRAAETALKREGSSRGKAPSPAAGPVEEIQERLMRYLGTRVRIVAEKGRGRITIPFHNEPDLARLVELILK